jgi:hypothetical protein
MFSENQIYNSTLKKTITNFDSYEKKLRKTSLKKIFDFNRYIVAKHYKTEDDLTNFYKIKKRIDANSKISDLNVKQRLY